MSDIDGMDDVSENLVKKNGHTQMNSCKRKNIEYSSKVTCFAEITTTTTMELCNFKLSVNEIV